MRRALSFAALTILLSSWAAPSWAEGGVFTGTTPCDPAVKRFLLIPSAEKCERVRWNLTLALDEKTSKPSTAIASVEYGLRGKALKKLKREGTWSLGVGAGDHTDAAVYELKRGKATIALWKITDDVVYLLDANRKLMSGNARYGYSLSHPGTEVQTDPVEAAPEGTATYQSPAAGANVFGMFEGRTPCAGAALLGVESPAGCVNIPWRVTLFRNPGTRKLTNYRLEGALFPKGAREGAVTALPGTPFDATAEVYRLETTETNQAVYLMRGDDNVLFLLDSGGKLLLGDRDNGYALNRIRR
jgi:hypothetical protein